MSRNIGNSDLPAENAVSVTPSNTVDFDTFSRALYVGGGGDLVAVFENDVAVTFVGIPAGFILPVRVKRVNATGTTASNIVALY